MICVRMSRSGMINRDFIFWKSNHSAVLTSIGFTNHPPIVNLLVPECEALLGLFLLKQVSYKTCISV